MSENSVWCSKMQEGKKRLQSGYGVCAYSTCLKIQCYFLLSRSQVCPGEFRGQSIGLFGSWNMEEVEGQRL